MTYGAVVVSTSRASRMGLRPSASHVLTSSKRSGSLPGVGARTVRMGLHLEGAAGGGGRTVLSWMWWLVGIAMIPFVVRGLMVVAGLAVGVASILAASFLTAALTVWDAIAKARRPR